MKYILFGLGICALAVGGAACFWHRRFKKIEKEDREINWEEQ